MTLTQAEEKLITTLRQIDKANPAAIDGFTTASHLAMCQTIASGGLEEGALRYQRFLKQAKRQPVVNLLEVQQRKAATGKPRP